MQRKIIIAGGRNFNNYELLKKEAMEFIGEDNVIIISGSAKGADRLGEKFAVEFNYQTLIKPANWNLYGKSAGYIRNEEMAKEGTDLLAFWDGKSRGTMHMINLARKYNLNVKVIRY